MEEKVCRSRGKWDMQEKIKNKNQSLISSTTEYLDAWMLKSYGTPALYLPSFHDNMRILEFHDLTRCKTSMDSPSISMVGFQFPRIKMSPLNDFLYIYIICGFGFIFLLPYSDSYIFNPAFHA